MHSFLSDKVENHVVILLKKKLGVDKTSFLRIHLIDQI